jgi:CTP:molybdopterin cytidylyltransferase MocA
MPTGIGAPTAVVLAAGSSERLGRDKLLIDLGGTPLLQRTVDSYSKAAKVGDVLVVLRPGQKSSWSWLASVKVHLVENPDPSGGMITSIRTALGSAWTKGKDFLLAPADVPFVKPEMVDRIVVDFRTRGPDALIPVYRGLGGHPGMYSASLQRDFFLHGDKQGTREVLQRHREKTIRLAVPEPDVCFDVDTEEDVRIAMDPGARWARVDADVEAKGQARRGA